MSEHQEAVENREADTLEISPGERLRLARERSDLTIDQVASHLKLNAEKISALERGEVDQLAAPVFVAGYLRAYAKLVDLPEEEVIADFKALSSMQAPSMDPSTSPAANNFGEMESVSVRKNLKSQGSDWSQITMWGSAIVILLVIVFVMFSGEETETIINKTNKPIISEMENNPVPETPRSGENINNPDMSNVEEEQVNLEKEPEQVPATVTEVEQPALKAAVDKSNQPASDTTNGNQQHSVIVFNFREDSWISVTDAQQKRLLFRLGKAGSSRTVWGLAPFQIQLGYVKGVDIIFNGEPYDLTRFANRRSVKFRLGKSEDRMSTN